MLKFHRVSTTSSAPTTTTKARMEEHSKCAQVMERRRAGENADLLHHGSGQSMAETWRLRSFRTRNRSEKWLPDEELSVYRAEIEETGSRAPAVVSVQDGQQVHRRVADFLRPDHRRAVDVHRRKADWGSYHARRAGKMKASRARKCGAAICSTAQARVSAEQPEAVSRLLIEFCKRSDRRSRVRARPAPSRGLVSD